MFYPPKWNMTKLKKYNAGCQLIIINICQFFNLQNGQKKLSHTTKSCYLDHQCWFLYHFFCCLYYQRWPSPHRPPTPPAGPSLPWRLGLGKEKYVIIFLVNAAAGSVNTESGSRDLDPWHWIRLLYHWIRIR